MAAVFSLCWQVPVSVPPHVSGSCLSVDCHHATLPWRIFAMLVLVPKLNSPVVMIVLWYLQTLPQMMKVTCHKAGRKVSPSLSFFACFALAVYLPCLMLPCPAVCCQSSPKPWC